MRVSEVDDPALVTVRCDVEETLLIFLVSGLQGEIIVTNVHC